jgi:hypothetical protein
MDGGALLTDGAGDFSSSLSRAGIRVQFAALLLWRLSRSRLAGRPSKLVVLVGNLFQDEF